MRALKHHETMQRIVIFIFSVVGFVSGPLLTAADKPNIIVILADDMGWMDSTPYG